MPDMQIAAFGEDFAHRGIVDPLIARIAAQCGLRATVDWRNARHGHGRVVAELGEYFRDLRGQGDSPDLVVVVTDANCKGFVERSRQIPRYDGPAPAVLAIPDPHIERWLLLDGAAFKTVFGRGCQAPDQKCDRDRYKQSLIRAIYDAGVIPSLGGIEFAEDLVQAMDLDRAARADVSFKRFLDDLRGALGAFGDRP